MQTRVGAAIAIEAARLAFLCGYGAGIAGAKPDILVDSELSFEREKAELLAGIWDEVTDSGIQPSELSLGVYREMLSHLAGMPQHSLLGQAEFTIH